MDGDDSTPELLRQRLKAAAATAAAPSSSETRRRAPRAPQIHPRGQPRFADTPIERVLETDPKRSFFRDLASQTGEPLYRVLDHETINHLNFTDDRGAQAAGYLLDAMFRYLHEQDVASGSGPGLVRPPPPPPKNDDVDEAEGVPPPPPVYRDEDVAELRRKLILTSIGNDAVEGAVAALRDEGWVLRYHTSDDGGDKDITQALMTQDDVRPLFVALVAAHILRTRVQNNGRRLKYNNDNVQAEARFRAALRRFALFSWDASAKRIVRKYK